METEFDECSVREINVSTLSGKAKYDFPNHSSCNEDLDEKCLHVSMSITPVKDEDADILVWLLIQPLSVERKGHHIVLTTANGKDAYNGCVPLHLELMVDNESDMYNAQHQQDFNVVLIDQLANTDDTTTCLVNNWETKFIYMYMKSITIISMKHDISSTASFLSEFPAVMATYVSTLSTEDNYGLLGKFIIHFRKNEWTEEVNEELKYKEVKCFINNLHRKQLGALLCRSDAALSSSITQVGNVKDLLYVLIQYNRRLLQLDHLTRCIVVFIDRYEKDATSCLVKHLETTLVRIKSFIKDLKLISNITASFINQKVNLIQTETLPFTALKNASREILSTRSATTERKSDICTSATCTKLKLNIVDNILGNFAKQHDFTVAKCDIFTKHDYEEVQNLFIINDKNFNVGLLNVVKPYLVLSGMVACIYYALSQKHSISASKNSGSISVDLWVISCIILSSKNVILLRDSTLQKKQQLYNYLFSTLQKYCEQNNDNMIYKKKSIETLKTIIKQYDYTRNDTYLVCPVHNFYFDNLSNELNRVGTLRQYPADNCPSLIRLAAAGFYYTGKGREVRCFSCDVSCSDWSYNSVPSEVHRRISPDCEYLNERFPIDKTHILPKSTDGSQRSVELSHTSPSHEIVCHSSSGSVVSADSCTIGNNTQQSALLTSASQGPVITPRSLDSGYGSNSSSSSSGSSSYNSRTSVSTNSSRGKSSRDSGYGSNSSLNQLSFVSNSDINVDIGSRNAPLPDIAEGPQSVNDSYGATGRDSQTKPENVPKTNTPPPKYPEYVLIERRRASFKNWPENLKFLHPLDLSECGFFYSNFGDCVRCHQCGIGLRNWESDDNPWVEHARWSRKCFYLVQKKGQDFIDSVLTVLGLQTDTEIEQAVGTPSEPLLPPKTGNATDSLPQSSEDGDPLTHEAAKYVIREKIFGSNLEKVKLGMNILLEKMDWRTITKEELVLTILEHENGTGLEANSSAVSSNAVKKKSEKSDQHDNTPKIKEEVLEKRMDTEGPNGDNPEEIQKENEELRDLYTCKICLDEKVGITFVPCGHLVTCKNCSPKIRKCPLCRTFIRGTIKTTI